jgi:hypothetical protein
MIATGLAIIRCGPPFGRWRQSAAALCSARNFACKVRTGGARKDYADLHVPFYSYSKRSVTA